MDSLLLTLVLASAGAPPQAAGPPPASARPAPADLGAQRCADCHASVVATYAETGMARALGPLVAGELAGLDEVPAGATGYRYRLEGGGRPGEPRPPPAWVVESFGAPGSPGELRSSARLDFAIGAGVLDRSYVALRHGRWWFAPLEVLSADGDRPRRAVLAPGHAAIPGLRFDNPITEECLACHTDQLPPRDYPLNLQAPPSAGWTPRGISCAACHAGAEAHADWREAELGGGEPAGRDPILRHAELDTEQRLSVCARCHLQGDARIALRPGERGVPAPGGDFLDQWAVFVPRRPDDDVAFVSQVERLVASPCYLGSREAAPPARPLTCETCHDPHRSSADARERRRVRDACLGCHAEGSGAGERAPCSLPRPERGARDCVDCHMRRTEVFDVGQVRIHDHRIARDPGPAGEHSAVRMRHSTDGDLAAFAWPGRQAPGYAHDPGLAMMAAFIAGFPERALPYLDREPSASVAALATYRHLRGVLLERAGRDAEAARAYEAALTRDREQIESAVNLLLVLARLGRTAEGLRLAERVLELHPRAEGALRNRALLHLAAGDQAAFAADLEAAQALFPRAALARTLAQLAGRGGDPAAAQRLLEDARRLAPHEAEGD